MCNNILPCGSNGVLVYGWLQKAGKESPPLLPSPADPCTLAANDSVQQVSKGASTSAMMLCIVYLVAGNVNYNGRQH